MKQRRKTVPEMDDWTKMILLKDVKHIENEKMKKKAKEQEKTEQAKFLDMQLQWREKEKLTYKEDKLEYARMLERKAQELEAEKRAAEEEKKKKVAESKREEAKQIEEIKRRREEQAEREKRDAEEQLAIYAAQIEVEKVQQKQMQMVKLKQYAEVVKENDKALAKKRERKAAEAAEQERLFKIQNDMYDKQVSFFRTILLHLNFEKLSVNFPPYLSLFLAVPPPFSHTALLYPSINIPSRYCLCFILNFFSQPLGGRRRGFGSRLRR